MKTVRRFRPLPVVVALQALFALPAYAQFTVNTGVTDTVGKTLAGAAGTVQAGGTLTTNGATSAITLLSRSIASIPSTPASRNDKARAAR